MTLGKILWICLNLAVCTRTRFNVFFVICLYMYYPSGNIFVLAKYAFEIGMCQELQQNHESSICHHFFITFLTFETLSLPIIHSQVFQALSFCGIPPITYRTAPVSQFSHTEHSNTLFPSSDVFASLYGYSSVSEAWKVFVNGGANAQWDDF